MQMSQRPEDPIGQVEASSNVGRLAATIDRLRKEIQDAQLAAEGRALIELAKGILVERLHCGPTQAARQLAALAEQAGTLAAGAGRRHHQPDGPGPPQRRRPRLPGTGRRRCPRRRRSVGGGSAAHRRKRRAGRRRQPGVAESLLEHALAPLGATAVAVWAAGPDASLTLAGYAGFSAEEARRWRYVPPGVATPARRALVERRIVWFASLSDQGLPSIGHRQLSGGGRVTVPAGHGGPHSGRAGDRLAAPAAATTAADPPAGRGAGRAVRAHAGHARRTTRRTARRRTWPSSSTSSTRCTTRRWC